MSKSGKIDVIFKFLCNFPDYKFFCIAHIFIHRNPVAHEITWIHNWNEKEKKKKISILLNLANHTSRLTCPVCFLWNVPKNSTLNIEIMRTRYAKWLSICSWYCTFDNLYVQSETVIIILSFSFVVSFCLLFFCLLVFCYHIMWWIKKDEYNLSYSAHLAELIV